MCPRSTTRASTDQPTCGTQKKMDTTHTHTPQIARTRIDVGDLGTISGMDGGGKRGTKPVTGGLQRCDAATRRLGCLASRRYTRRVSAVHPRVSATHPAAAVSAATDPVPAERCVDRAAGATRTHTHTFAQEPRRVGWYPATVVMSLPHPGWALEPPMWTLWVGRVR
jgi:hypothetical protein